MVKTAAVGTRNSRRAAKEAKKQTKLLEQIAKQRLEPSQPHTAEGPSPTQQPQVLAARGKRNELVGSPSGNKPSLAQKIRDLSVLRDQGIISQGEYDTKRTKLLEEL